MSVLRQFVRDEAGATAIEYCLIAGGISIVIAVIVRGVGTNLVSIFTNVQAGFQ